MPMTKIVLSSMNIFDSVLSNPLHISFIIAESIVFICLVSIATHSENSSEKREIVKMRL